MSVLCWLGRHSWTRWELWPKGGGGIERRWCIRCGMVQREEL